MTVILDGRRAARERRDRLAVEVRSLRSPRRPTLATLRVDDDPRSDRHIGIKVRAAAEVGIALRRVDLPASTSPPVVEAAVDELVADGGVDGVFVQLPLAPELDAVPVLDRIPAGKDVDGLGSASRSCWEQGGPAFRPCAAEAVVGLLERYGIPVTGVEVVVVGHVAGLELLLGPVIEVGPGSPGLATVTAGAGLLVCAAGRPGLIGRRHVRPGATVVDVAGDVDRTAVTGHAGALVPMPGGVGPMTVAVLLEHTVRAAARDGTVP